jgi:prepilin-type processing-associated H-X9-DG protein
MLPYMEEIALFEMGTDMKPRGSVNPRIDMSNNDLLWANNERLQHPIEVWYCPSRRASKAYPIHPNRGTGPAPNPIISPYLVRGITRNEYKYARNDYAVNGGLSVRGTIGPWIGGGPTSLQIGDQQLATGWQPGVFYFNLHEFTGLVAAASEIRPRDVTDGLTHTYMFGEKYLSTDFYENGESMGDDQTVYIADFREMVRYAYINDPRYTNTPGYLKPIQDHADNDGIYIDSGEDLMLTYTFGSPHASGFNVALCDGSVRSISYEVKEEVHAALCNRCDGATINPNEY